MFSIIYVFLQEYYLNLDLQKKIYDVYRKRINNPLNMQQKRSKQLRAIKKKYVDANLQKEGGESYESGSF